MFCNQTCCCYNWLHNLIIYQAGSNILEYPGVDRGSSSSISYFKCFQNQTRPFLVYLICMSSNLYLDLISKTEELNIVVQCVFRSFWIIVKSLKVWKVEVWISVFLSHTLVKEGLLVFWNVFFRCVVEDNHLLLVLSGNQLQDSSSVLK